MIAAIVISLLASAALTAVVHRLAIRFGFVDSPDGHRKLHQTPVALGGGIALVAAFLGSMIVVELCGRVWMPQTCSLGRQLWMMIAAGAVIAGVGVADDRRAMKARVKLIGQLVAATILAAGGIVVHQIQFGSVQVDLGWAAIPATIFGLVAAMNAMNLLDGADGAASGVSAVILLSLACIATILGKPEIGLLSILFANAVLGLLWHNVPPARIYLGDAGSMFLGLVLGSLTILAMNSPQESLPLFPALAIWTIPILDSGCAILRRWLSQRPVFEADRAHIHHCMRSHIGSDLAVVACLVGCATIPSLSAIGAIWLQRPYIALVSFLAVPALLAVSGVFGRAEISLLAQRVAGLRPSACPPTTLAAPTNERTTIRVRESSHKEYGSKMPKKTSSADAVPHVSP